MSTRLPAATGGARLALTPAGPCGADDCSAPLFLELLTADAPGRCVDCAPLFVERRAQLRSLFVRSGGRLPADFGRSLAP